MSDPTKEELREEVARLQQKVGAQQQQIENLQDKIEVKDQTIIRLNERVTSIENTNQVLQQFIPEQKLQELQNAEASEDSEEF